MTTDIYIRPVGFVHVTAGPGHEDVQGAFRLAGHPSLDFTAIEIIERTAGGVRRRLTSLGELFERDWGRRAFGVSDTFERICAPRRPVAGLALDRPRIVGIVNVTPDSFSDGGRHATAEAAIAHGLALEAAGADILDIGGESTRPGSDPVPVKEELARVMPVIDGLKARSRARLSIDTRKAEIMRKAAAAGVHMINDVSALTHDPAALETVAELGLPVVLMHARGDPKTMQDAPTYGNVLLDVFDYLAARIAACEAAGIPRAKLIADPGIGFGKTAKHNLELMAGIGLLHGLGVALMLGASRKRFIGALTGVQVAAERVPGSLAAALAGVAQGVQILRVHDVAETRAALAVWQASVLGCDAGDSPAPPTSRPSPGQAHPRKGEGS